MKKKLLYLFVFILVSLISNAEGYDPKLMQILQENSGQICIYGDSVWVQNKGVGIELWNKNSRKKEFSVVEPSQKISKIEIDKYGNVWVCTDGDGLFQLVGSEWISYNSLNNLPDNIVNDIFFDDDTVWVATDGGLGKYYSGAWTSISEVDGLPPYVINAIARDSSGVFVIATGDYSNGGIYKQENNNWILFGVTKGLGDPEVLCLELDYSGQLWAGTYLGLAKVMKDTIINFTGSMFNNIVEGITPLKDSSLCLIHGSTGFTILDNNVFTKYNTYNFIGTMSTVYSASASDNSFYVSTSYGIYSVTNNDSIASFCIGYSGQNVDQLAIDTSDNIWFSINSPYFIFKYSKKDSVFEQINFNKNVFKSSALQILALKNGEVWILNSDDGIHVYGRDTIAIYNPTTVPVFQNYYYNSITEDSNGVIWLATDAGIYLYENNIWSEYEYNSLLKNIDVEFVAFEENAIWFDYYSSIGVSRLVGSDITHYTNPVLNSNSVLDIIIDSENTVYFKYNNGIQTYKNGVFSMVSINALLNTNSVVTYPEILLMNIDKNNNLYYSISYEIDGGSFAQTFIQEKDTLRAYPFLSLDIEVDKSEQYWITSPAKFLCYLRIPPVVQSEITDTICLGTLATFKNTSSSEINPIGWDINPVTNSYSIDKMDYFIENPSHLFDQVGKYKVRFYGTNGIDTNFVTKSVTVLPSPSVSITSVDDKNTICENSVLTLAVKGDADLNLKWSTGSESSMIEIKDAGTYLLLAANSYGCSVKDSFELHVNSAPIVSISASEENGKFCKQSSISLSALSDFSDFKWSNNETTQDITISEPGTYTVTVTDNIGCEGVAQFDVSYFEPTPAQIGIVTASELDEYLIVAWEKVGDDNIASYNVYQLNGSEYNKIGSVDKADPGLFLDKTSDFKKRAYTYKITTVDQCGYESSLDECIPHTSMHLVEIPSGNKYNLIWTPYRGIDPVSYTIYQTTDGTDIDIIETVSAIYNTTYTVSDYNPDKRFRVAMNPGYSIDPNAISELKSDSGPFSQSISNISESELTGLKTIEESTEIVLFPIPAITSINVVLVGEINENTVVGLYSSTGVLIDNIILSASLNATVSFNTSSLSTGLYEIKVETENSSIVRKFIKK